MGDEFFEDIYIKTLIKFLKGIKSAIQNSEDFNI